NHNAKTNKDTGATEFVYRDADDVDGDINPHDYEEFYNLDETKCGADTPRRTIIVPRISDSEVKWALSQPGLIDFLKEVLRLLVTALDFSSLYPSLMMTYNISPDRIIPIHRPDLREKAHKMGLTTHEIKFPFKGGLAAAWAVRHDNKFDPKLHDSIDENGASRFQDGVFSHIEKKLFARRNAIKKKELKPAAKIKHQLHETLQKIEKGEMKVSPEELVKIREDKRQADFTWADADARQRAVKLIMNTLYGVSGDKTRPIYILTVAGGITSAGRHCIMVAKKLVEAEGHKVVYGDTDSLYIEPKLDIFKIALWLYYGGLITRDEFSRRIVEITVWYTKNLQKRVNAALEADNGTNTMKMAYEEVLHPCVMVRMKKYAGLAHEDGFEGLSVMNYKWNQVTRRPIIPGDNVFLRGLDVVRRGTNDLTIRAFFAMLMYMCSADCRHSLQELVVRILDRTIAMDWPLETFAISQQYKPKTPEQRLAGKGNKTVLRFVDHMVARGLKFVPMERFKTVVVKRPVTYGPNGCPIKLKMADRIELVEQAEARSDELDLAHYMDGDTGILSMASKILSAWPRFEVAPVIIPTCGTADCIMSADYGTAAHKQRCDARTVSSRDENRTAIKASSDAVLKWLQSRVSVDGNSEESKAAAKEIVSDRRFMWKGVMRVLSEKFHMNICSGEPTYDTLSSIVMSELGIPAPRLKSGTKRFEVVNEESKRKGGFRDTVEITNTSKYKTRYVVPTGIIDTDVKLGGTKKWQQTIKKTLAAAKKRRGELRYEFNALPSVLRGRRTDANFNKYLYGIFENFQNVIWKTYQQVKKATRGLDSNLKFNETFKNVAHHVSMTLQSEYFDTAIDAFDREEFTHDVRARVSDVLSGLAKKSEDLTKQVEMLDNYAETVKICKDKIEFIEKELFMIRQVMFLEYQSQQDSAAYHFCK
ncbi:MAG: hypothetical protein CMK92_04750, partial [Pseudomonas sp.]|nr:hypothetical protein [Pseudomonas sp.]